MEKRLNQNKRGRILLITRYFPPLDSTATSRMYSWAKYLSRAGFDVSVLTTTKKSQVVEPLTSDVSCFNIYEIDYFDPITFMGLDKKSTLNKMTANNNNRGIKKWLLTKLSGIYRQRMNERMPGRTDSWILPAIRKMKKHRKEGVVYNHIISSYGPPSSHIVGYFAKKIFNAQWTADYRDLWLENHIYIGLWPFTLLEKYIEKKIIARSNALVTVSNHLGSVLQSKFVNVPVSIVENGYDTDEIAGSHNNYFSGKENKFRIVYTGSIYREKRDPGPLFKAVRELVSSHRLGPNKLEILFWGSVPGDIEELIQKHQLSSIAAYKGTVSKQNSLNIQQSADALLFLEWNDPSVKDIFTAKLFEYLAMDKPIIATGITPADNAGRLIEMSGSGIVCGNDIETIKNAILGIMNHSFRLKKNWDLINKFSREAEVDRLIKCLEGEVIPGVEF